MSDPLDKLEAKVDQLIEGQAKVNAHLERYNVLLDVHISRTDSNTEDINALKEEIRGLTAVSRVIKTGVPLLLSLIGLLAAIRSLF